MFKFTIELIVGKGVCNTTTPLTVAIILLRIDSKNPILDTKFTIGRFFLRQDLQHCMCYSIKSSQLIMNFCMILLL